MNETILIIDDKIKWCKSLAQNFTQRGYQAQYAVNGREAFQCLSQQHTHVILLDIMLGEEDGLNVLKDLLLSYPDLPVIMITGFGSIDTAVQAMKLGAFDYITKPVDFEKLLKVVEHALTMSHVHQKEQPANRSDFPALVTQNDAMLRLCGRAKKFAATDLPILLTGENGTGKEIIADFIHAHSARNTYQMLKINCAAFPENLLDNELFGHEKGAYTGADSVFQGVFERAHGSSLFLDEIGDMPLTIQAKILRTLQSREIRRIGGSRNIHVDVRFIAATNKDLPALIGKQIFRQDLYYRLNATILHLPALRERKDDIPLLARHFLAEFAKAHATSATHLSSDVLARLDRHHWPGNVRELKNTVNYAATIVVADAIAISDLPPHFTRLTPTTGTSNIREDMERDLILSTLEKVNYNKKKAAELLNMSRKTLYNKMDKYSIPLSR